MPDIRNIRTRPGVRIYLHPTDLVLVFMQDDVLKSFTEEELDKMLFAIETEKQERDKRHD